MHQTQSCNPPGCQSENRCVNDYPVGVWTNQGCGGNDCTSEQMYQTSSTYYGCYTAEQCVNDPCTSWVDQTCGGDACLPSQMYQTRDCTYNCKAESQCNDRTLGSPTPSVDPSCGSGETEFDFSWTKPGSSTCPIKPIKYFWKIDDSGWSSPLLERTVSGGPYGHGSHTFSVKARDASERESLARTVSFTVDALGPSEPDPTYAPGCDVAEGDEVTFSWDPATDEGCASGTIEYVWKVDEESWSNWGGATSATWTAVTDDHTFYVKARDGVGNESEIGSVTIGVDCTDGPTIVIETDPCTRVSKRRPRWEWEDEGDVIPNCAPGMRETDTYQVFLDNDPTEEGVTLVDQGFQTESFFQAPSDLGDGYYALVVRGFDSCDQFSDNEAPGDAFVDGTAPVFTDLRCFQSGGEGEDLEACLAGICSQNNYVKFEWEATDSGAYPSGLRPEDPYYWYANFGTVGVSGRNGWLDEKHWGPHYISDSVAPLANRFNVVAVDVCGNDGNPAPGTIPPLLVDTSAPNSTISTPANQFCFREGEEFTDFTGTVRDEACAGVFDLDLWIQRKADDFCWDGDDWVDSCPLLLDTDVNDLDPPAAAGLDVPWSRVNDLPWPADDSADGEYQVCAVGEDAFGQVEGMTDSCNTFIYDNILPTCGNTIALFDAETGGWVTTATNLVLVETIGFWDQNCAQAIYKVRILREGVRLWPSGQDWYIVVDTICSTNGGYPNNDYIFESIPTGFTDDGDQLEVCFDVVDCADNKASENPIEDCPVMEWAPGLCKTVTIFDPAWFQTEDGNVHANTETTASILSYIPEEADSPYFSKGTVGNISAGGGMNFGKGEVSLKGWRVDDYSGSLYQAERKDYDYFWELFGRPTEAPELKGNTSNPCNDGLESADGEYQVCYNPDDLTIEWKEDDEPFDFGGRGGIQKKVIFVDGDLQLNRKVIVEDEDEESVVVFIVSGDLNISWDLESDDTDDPIVEGVYVVDGNVYSARIAENEGKECIFDEEIGSSDPDTCEYDHNNNPEYSENEWPGERLVARGIFITYGGFRLIPPYGRNLKACTDGRLICNKNTPAELFIYRPDLFENLPDILKEQSLSWGEVAP